MKLQRRKFLKSAALLGSAAMPGMGLASDSTDYRTTADDTTLLNVGLQKQLFFDNLLIESVQCINREYHQPRKCEQNPLISKDKPWEHVLYIRTASYRVLRDPKDKLYKAWYSDEGFTNELIRSGATTALYREEYAYSEDGIKWVKPPLGIYYEAGQNTNIFRGGPKEGSAEVFDVMLDPFEKEESRRFKSIYLHAPVKKNGEWQYEQSHYVISYSEDGIHWKDYDELPHFGPLGSQLSDVPILSYDLDSKLYILNTRHLNMSDEPAGELLPQKKSFIRPFYPDNFAKSSERRIFQCESSDLFHWNEPRLILAPDDSDNLDEQLYGMAQYRVGSTWIGFVNVFHVVDDTMDVQVAYSLDRCHWNRIRKPWFTTGPAGSWDQFMVEIANNPIEVGDELWFYYGGNGYGHHDWYTEWYREGLKIPDNDVSKVGFFLGLAKLRLEGFCSLNAGEVREGILVTRHLTSAGTGVGINAECGPGGYIDVEVLNQADQVLPGCSREEFDRFTGNAVKHQLSWRSRTTIPVQPYESLSVKPVSYRRLVFYMRNAKLYSFRFTA